MCHQNAVEERIQNTKENRVTAHDENLHSFLSVPLCTQIPIIPIFVVPYSFLKALVSILAAYSFVNMPSTARASTPQLFLMALGLVVHAAQTVAVFGMMAAAWSGLLFERVIIWIGFTRPPGQKWLKTYANSHITKWGRALACTCLDYLVQQLLAKHCHPTTLVFLLTKTFFSLPNIGFGVAGAICVRSSVSLPSSCTTTSLEDPVLAAASNVSKHQECHYDSKSRKRTP